MATFYSPEGNPEVWEKKPKGYFTPEEWDTAHPPVNIEMSLDDLKAAKIASVDENTRLLILSGFDFDVKDKTYHFGYDAEDQGNFTKAAVAATLALVTQNADFRQPWRGWLGGEPCTLSLTATEFLALATYGGKDHQEGILASGWAITNAIRNATTPEAVEEIVDTR